MSGYLQRLFDRAAAAAVPVPSVTVAGRLGAPMAEADQRLMNPGVEPGIVPFDPIAGDEPDAFDVGPLGDTPAPARPAAPVTDVRTEPPAIRTAENQSRIEPVTRPVQNALAPAPAPVEPVLRQPPPTSESTTVPSVDPLPEIREAPVADLSPVLPVPPPDPTPEVVPVVGRTNAPIAPQDAPIIEPSARTPDAVPADPVPAVAPIEAPLATPDLETLDAPVTAPQPAQSEIQTAEPTFTQIAPEPMPAPDILPMAEPVAQGTVTERETVVELPVERPAEPRQSTPTPAPTPLRQPEEPIAQFHVTAASVSVIGPLPTYQRAPMLRGRRRR